MSFESTVVLIKPDGVRMGVAEKIIERYLAAGLELYKRQDFRFLPHQAEIFYAEHSGTFYFAGLVLAISSGPSIALMLHGNDAIARVREMNGAADPNKAAQGTIRHDFRSAGGPFNTVHGSDSITAAFREMEIVFRKA